MNECDAEPSAAPAPVPGRSPWPRAPLSGACSFARSNALIRAVYEEEKMSEKDLLKHLDGKADGKKVAKAKAEKEAVVSEEATGALLQWPAQAAVAAPGTAVARLLNGAAAVRPCASPAGLAAFAGHHANATGSG